MLSQKQIEAIKSREKPFKVSDGDKLYLQVNPNGSKLWRMNYRHGGKQGTLAFGAFPVVSPKEARLMRDQANLNLAAGEDPHPGAAAKAEKAAAEKAVTESFEATARRWHKSQGAIWSPDHGAKILHRLERDIFPAIGHLPVGEIDGPTLLDAIRKIEARGTIEQAARIKNNCGSVFRFAVAEGKAKYDPSAALADALEARRPVVHRRPIPRDELPTFLVKLNAYDGEEQTREALRLVAYTFVRTMEVRFARVEEFTGLIGREPLWRIPSERMKMKLQHLVPLSPQAVKAVRRLIEIGNGDPLLCPALPGAKRKHDVMSENTMLFAMYRMGYHSKATVHGLRGTASTILNESNQFRSEWIERQLAHVEGNQVRAAYNAAEWLPDRRRMMQWWADYLDMRQEEGELIG